MEAQLSRTIDLATRVESDWVSFDPKTNVPLSGLNDAGQSGGGCGYADRYPCGAG